MRLAALPFALAAACALPAAAHAGDWTVQVGAATDYISKGISKSDEKAQGWGRVEWAGPEDFYAGAFATNADLSAGADAEIQLYGGWRPEALGYEWDLGLVYKTFPGTRADLTDDMIELKGEVARAIGPVKGRLHVDWSPDNYGSAKQALWVEGRLGYAVARKTEVSVGLGRREQENGADYTAWNIGVKQKLTDKLSGDLRWYDTNGHEFGDVYDGRLVAAITATF
jgi:uncharacterized protein (TIGR02001 family)